MDRRLVFWSRWLLVSAAIVFVFGLALVVIARPMQSAFESLYFTPRTGSELGADAVAYTTFLQAVLGATMLGWATVLLLVILGPFRRAESSAWNMITASLVVWFVSDTAFSLWSGYWQNAVLNTGLVVLFAVPLTTTYRLFYPRRT